jgi:two-component sensor histidine kinase
MSIPEPPSEQPPEPAASKQVEEILSSPELLRAVENDDFKTFLDHIPVGIAVARNGDARHRIVYANQAFELLSGSAAAALTGNGWSVLDGFVSEDDAALTLGAAVAAGEDFIGTFRRQAAAAPGAGASGAGVGQAAGLVQAYVGVIEHDDGSENYRIAALVDVSDRERSQRDQFERDIRTKDLLLKELQHRVKNNLQLVVALIRLEARAARLGDAVDFDRLARRIDALAALYQILEGEPNARQVDLGGYLSQIASSVARAHSDGSIALELKVSFCPASINVALPAGLLLNELMTNSLKYAFAGRDKGVVALECSRLDDDRYRIVVADDGVGLAPGTSWPAPGKLGALILQTLRENTKRTEFGVVSTPGEGTRVSIEFVHHAPAPRAN